MTKICQIIQPLDSFNFKGTAAVVTVMEPSWVGSVRKQAVLAMSHEINPKEFRLSSGDRLMQIVCLSTETNCKG